MTPYFLNVDFELILKSKSNVGSIVAGLGSRVMVIDQRSLGGGKHVCAFELPGRSTNPDGTIHGFCNIFEKLPLKLRGILAKGKKEFDIGFEFLPDARFSKFVLRQDTLQRVAKLGATLAVTFYPSENLKTNRKVS